MHNVLVAGAASFLGYHVVKRLNARHIRPRVLDLRDSPRQILDALDVERSAGSLDDPASVRAACAGVDTLFHLAFKVGVGSGGTTLEDMRRVNVDGSRQLLETASASGVRRAVVTGSALAVGVNRRPVPLDESAHWSEHAFDLPYAVMRREAELDALARTSPVFAVMSVCPSFTFGPDDPVGAPANRLIQTLIKGRLPFTLDVGVGCLDVRDFAQGMVLTVERGQSGERYLLSGENVTADQLLEQAASIAGVRAPRFRAPLFLLRAAVGALGLFSRVRGKPSPVSGDVLQVVGRYAWYDASKARNTLGWTSRPLRDTLDDTIRSLRLAD
jgi:dihydroflavonol-4-reductase